ncbi:preprotein translocase subunit SecA [Buchnera aphidicola]
MLPEAFATIREASKRVFDMRHFDVQIFGGIVLHQNCIAEMRTGEGKTLTSTLPVYLNSLKGYGVHIITMNEYLADRDSKHNSELFKFLGLTVGLNTSSISIKNKKRAYASDITYGTNNEFCFDYLRDNMVLCSDDRVQRGLYYAVIDEVDSILIDEARTPLVISGPFEENLEIYSLIDSVVQSFLYDQKKNFFLKKNNFFVVDKKNKQIFLTEDGFQKFENILLNHSLLDKRESLYSEKKFTLIKYIISSLRAHVIFKKDIDYVVQNKKIIIIDEHTGRMMLDRRWSDGLHQSVEAKEKVTILNENQTLASITFQNYFRLYERICGMTGTAYISEREFKIIYNLKTVIIPTNRPMVRKDFSDVVYISEREKIKAIVQDIKQCVLRKQPVLVGTTSIKNSEIISKKLINININHNVLNAKLYEKEANIISQAGRLGAVTISTNMAGRGTDIILGGSIKKNINTSRLHDIQILKKWKKEHQLVIASGGLHVIGTERHDSRRIDNQLRGRSGRQGDPGSSRFYLSLDDPLIQIFISKNIKDLISKFRINFGEPLNHSWVTHSISYAQKKVENYNFKIRKKLLEYDNVLNQQRIIFYSIRNNVLEYQNTKHIFFKNILIFLYEIINKNCSNYVSRKYWNVDNIERICKNNLYCKIKISIIIKNNSSVISNTWILNKVYKVIRNNYRDLEKRIIYFNMRNIEKIIILKCLDSFWVEHLSFMEYLRTGIHFRGYAQKNPTQEYMKEAFDVFSRMLCELKNEIVTNICKKFFS